MKRTLTALLALSSAGLFSMPTPSLAQGQGPVQAIVACAVDDSGKTPCPASVTQDQVDRAIQRYIELTGVSRQTGVSQVGAILDAKGTRITAPQAAQNRPATGNANANNNTQRNANAQRNQGNNNAQRNQGTAGTRQQTVVERIVACALDQTGATPCPRQATEGQIKEAIRRYAQRADVLPGTAGLQVRALLERKGTRSTTVQQSSAPAAQTNGTPRERAQRALDSLPPDATPQQIAGILAQTTDQAARRALLKRLQDTVAAKRQSRGGTGNANANAGRTGAQAPSAADRQERRRLAQQSTQQALSSAALQSMNAGGTGSAPAQGRVQTEVVTEQTARSSDEDTADDDGENELLRILGGAAAGIIIGELLDNGDRVVERTNDRVVVNRDGEYVVLKDENTLLRRPGTQVETTNFDDGSTRTLFRRDDGTEVVTVRGPDGRILYRERIGRNGNRTVLIDERRAEEPFEITRLPLIDQGRAIDYRDDTTADALARALRQTDAASALDRNYSLRQVRENIELRELMPRVDLDAITFDTGSAAIRPDQARALSTLGNALSELIDENPGELFLIEGHTDSVGGEVLNLALSDRRAESVALALTEYFGIPPENMITQGYGERFLKYDIAGDIRENRRAAVRRITPLIRTAQN